MKKKLGSIGKFAAAAFVVVAVIGGLIAYGESQEKASQPSPLSNIITAEDHVIGNTEAQVTVIEYADFQCPACRTYAQLLTQLYSEYGDRVRFVYRHFPLNEIHPNAEEAAWAAEAAGAQGKFFEFAEALFVKQNEWDKLNNPLPEFRKYAEVLGLDVTAFETYYRSGEAKARVNADLRSGLEARVNSTPTFFLNGKPIDNPRGYEAFTKLLNEELSAKGLPTGPMIIEETAKDVETVTE